MTSTPARSDDDATDYLLTREVAELLRTPESTVRYWRHIRTGPPSVKVGRRVLYSRCAVMAWLAECAQTTVPGARVPGGDQDATAERVDRLTSSRHRHHGR